MHTIQALVSRAYTYHCLGHYAGTLYQAQHIVQQVRACDKCAKKFPRSWCARWRHPTRVQSAWLTSRCPPGQCARTGNRLALYMTPAAAPLAISSNAPRFLCSNDGSRCLCIATNFFVHASKVRNHATPPPVSRRSMPVRPTQRPLMPSSRSISATRAAGERWRIPAMVCTCILHLISSRGVSTKPVVAPDTAAAIPSIENGRGLLESTVKPQR